MHGIISPAYGFIPLAAISVNPQSSLRRSAGNIQETAPPPCPVVAVGESSVEMNILDDFESRASKQLGVDDPAKIDAKPELFEKMKTGLNDFFVFLSKFGKAKNDTSPPSILAGMVCGFVVTATVFVPTALQAIGPSVHRIFNGAAALFDSNTDDAARMLFSGLCVVSAGLRAVNPVLNEVASDIHDPTAKIIFTTAQVVLSSIYVATSFISSLLAANDAVAGMPKKSEVLGKIKKSWEEFKQNINKFAKQDNKAELIKDWMLEQIQAQIDTMKNAGIRGGVTTTREVLMFAGAVLSLIALTASLPVLAITAGAVNLVANVCDIVHGALDLQNANGKLTSLKESKENLEQSLLRPDMPEDEAPRVKGLLKIVDREIGEIEKDRALAITRLVKGVLGSLFSISAIITGSLMLSASIAIPFLPVIATCLSLISVTVLGLANLLIRNRNARNKVQDGEEKGRAAEFIENPVNLYGIDEDFLSNRHVALPAMVKNYLKNIPKSGALMIHDVLGKKKMAAFHCRAKIALDELLVIKKEFEAKIKKIDGDNAEKESPKARTNNAKSIDQVRYQALVKEFIEIEKEYLRKLEAQLASLMGLKPSS
jgi:hypothetical protein